MFCGHRPARHFALAATLAGCAIAPLMMRPSLARADRLAVETHAGEAGYAAIDEQSYEAIVEPSSTFAHRLRIRVALHNHGQTPRDAVHTLALPYASQLEALAINRAGTWHPARPTAIALGSDRRDPGTVFVRQIQPDPSGVPAAELVVFGVEPDTTVQIEITVAVHPRFSGDRWELDLPSRGPKQPNLAIDRRIVVRGLPPRKSFFVDGIDQKGSNVALSHPVDTVTVSWPATSGPRNNLLDGHYEVTPARGGSPGGRFRVVVQLGAVRPIKSDHLLVLVDRSQSTRTAFPNEAMRLLEGLLDAVPPKQTYEVIAFHRQAMVVPKTSTIPYAAADRRARTDIGQALMDLKPQPGTDIMAALAFAIARAPVGRRTQVVVVTDGMIATEVSQAAVTKLLDHAARTRRILDVLFVVDDPWLSRHGLSPDHRIARLAAKLGARVNLTRLDAFDPDNGVALLTAPGVLGDLKIAIPHGMTLDHAPPSGLVSGDLVLLHGHYDMASASRLKLSGRLGRRRVRKTLRREHRLSGPPAYVATTSADTDAADAAREGFTSPPWYLSDQKAAARRGVVQAGRFGEGPAGYLSRDIVRHYLTTRVLPRARVCYNHGLGRDPEQAGRVVLDMEVGQGEVVVARTQNAELHHDDPALLACLTDAAWSLGVPAAKMDAHTYRIRYPLRLIPPETPGRAGRVVRISDAVTQWLRDH